MDFYLQSNEVFERMTKAFISPHAVDQEGLSPSPAATKSLEKHEPTGAAHRGQYIVTTQSQKWHEGRDATSAPLKTEQIPSSSLCPQAWEGQPSTAQ